MPTDGIKRVLSVAALALVAGLILVVSDTSFAQEKKKISWTTKAENTKFSYLHRLDIPDMPGHRLGLFEVQRTWPDGGGPAVDGRKVIEEITRGTADGVAGNGREYGYDHWRFENGDQAFNQYHLTFQSVINPDQSRKTTYVGTYLHTGGTGALKGLKGLGRFAGLTEFNAEGKPTRNEYSAEGEYWFEK
jgi:hypothetical protein